MSSELGELQRAMTATSSLIQHVFSRVVSLILAASPPSSGTESQSNNGAGIMLILCGVSIHCKLDSNTVITWISSIHITMQTLQ